MLDRHIVATGLEQKVMYGLFKSSNCYNHCVYVNVIRRLQAFSNGMFRICQISILRSVSRVSSATAELLVNFGASFISQEWLKLKLSNFVYKETISILAKGMTSHPKRGVVGLTWSTFACAIIDFKNFVMVCTPTDVKWGQQFRRQWISVAHTYDGRCQWCYTLRLKLHWFDLLWICCKLVCIICPQQIDQ